jgi:Zn-dependent peptidase ImmA (M78 family)
MPTYTHPAAWPVHKLNEARALILPFQTRIPVDVNLIAKELGIGLWEFKNFNDTTSGKLFRDDQYGGTSRWSIGVNAKESHQRKRFTVAHEIAHFLLHRDKIGDELSDDSFYRSKLLTSKEEHQANRLAAEILMPFHLIQQLQLEGINDIDELARRFEVSSTAMKIRLGIPVY